MVYSNLLVRITHWNSYYEVKKEINDQDEEIIDWKIENKSEVILDCTFIELVSINVKEVQFISWIYDLLSKVQ